MAADGNTVRIDPQSADTYRTGPETLGGRYMRQFWQPVALSQDIKVGEAKPIRIMSENFTLYRGESGLPFVVAQRCPHRGTQLSVGWVEGDTIRCRYHGWRFAGDGQCVEMPAGPSEYAARMKIAHYPTHDHLGLVFVYFGVGKPPAFPPVPGFDGEGLVEGWVEEFGCNFFQTYENDWDEYHVAWTHRTGGVHTAPKMSEQTLEETDYGVLKLSRKEDGTRRTTVFFMPGALRLVVPTQSDLSYAGVGPAYRDTYIFHTPIDDESQLFFVSQHVPVTGKEAETYAKHYDEFIRRRRALSSRDRGEDILAGKRRLKDLLDHPNLAVLEDYIAQVGQGRIADRSSEHLARTDAGVLFLRKLWTRELKLLAEGRPTKQWSPLTEMPHAEINQAVLKNNRGTGARAAADVG